MNTQKKEIQKKRKSQKESVPVSPALYHEIFILKSNVDTPIELDTIMCANWLIDWLLKVQQAIFQSYSGWEKFVNKKSERGDSGMGHDKINNRAMIRPPSFMTIEGRLLSVRTVIKFCTFLNQLIVYTCTIWKLAFSKLTKITPLTCSPFYQYNVCHDVTYQ